MPVACNSALAIAVPQPCRPILEHSISVCCDSATGIPLAALKKARVMLTLDPTCTHSWAVGQPAALPIGSLAVYMSLMKALILAALMLLLSTRAAARARDRNRPNRNAACEGRPGAAGCEYA